VALTSIQKAATLLVSVDSATAAELLKGLAVEDVEKLGLELAHIDASGGHNRKEQTRIVQEFVESLQQGGVQATNIRSFLNETLLSVVGEEKAEQIQAKIRKVTERKDPFAEIRGANLDELVVALDGEHPQTVAVVLGELPAKKSQEVLSYLGDEIRTKAICRMTNEESPGGAVKERIASMVSAKLRSLQGEVVLEKPGRREETLRKLAIMLGGLEKELRDQLLEEIKKQDEQTCTTVRNLMVTWEDIPSIADRSLQEAIRSVDAKKLAVALFGAEEQVAEKIRNNISERAAAALDEESSLMQEPLPKEVLGAREEVVKPLREANEQDKLRFVGR